MPALTRARFRRPKPGSMRPVELAASASPSPARLRTAPATTPGASTPPVSTHNPELNCRAAARRSSVDQRRAHPDRRRAAAGQWLTLAAGGGARAPDRAARQLATALVAALIGEGVDTIFGVGGTHTLQLLGAIEANPSMAFVPARTELGAAYMAIGYARATRRPAIVLTSTGPGALNVAAALQEAAWSSIPMLHLTTSIGGPEFAGAVHETPDQVGIMKLAGKGWICLRESAVRRDVATAVRTAAGQPGGAVTLDVMAGRWASLVHNDDGPPAIAEPAQTPDLEEVIADVSAATRPILFVGGGAIRTDGGAAALSLAEHIGAPS
jgi:acetolactate synthase-1/2/3 large subunit